MKKIIVAALASVALLTFAPIGVDSANAQTVVIKRGHAHGHGHVHMHGPRKKVVVIRDRRHHGWTTGRHRGWSEHRHVRGRGHMNHNHGTVGVGVTVR